MDLWTFEGVDVSVACLHLVRLASYKNVSFYSNHTIGTNGPSELPCTQLHHIENKEMHIHQQNHWKDIGGGFSIGTNRTTGTNGPLELPCTQLDRMRK